MVGKNLFACFLPPLLHLKCRQMAPETSQEPVSDIPSWFDEWRNIEPQLALLRSWSRLSCRGDFLSTPLGRGYFPYAVQYTCVPSYRWWHFEPTMTLNISTALPEWNLSDEKCHICRDDGCLRAEKYEHDRLNAYPDFMGNCSTINYALTLNAD